MDYHRYNKCFVLGIYVITTMFLTACTNPFHRDSMTNVADSLSGSTVTKSISSPSFGNPASKIRITIYSDYQCPACIVFHEQIGNRLISNYADANKVSVTFKNFPLPMHSHAVRDALGSLCAANQGKYLEFSDGMYALEKARGSTNGDVTDTDRTDVADTAGLQSGDFATCLAEGHYLNQIKQDIHDGINAGVEGTPSIFINGIIMKFNSVENFFAILDGSIEKEQITKQ